MKLALNENINVITEIIEMEVSTKTKQTYTLPTDLKDAMGRLISKLKDKWQQCYRRETTFFQKYDEWLNVPVPFVVGNKANTSGENTTGRSSTSWEDLSERSKRRRTQKIRTEYTAQELSYATQMSLRSVGNLNAAIVVKDVGLGSPSTGRKYREPLQSISEKTLSPDAAVSLIVECKLSKSQYQSLRNVSLENDCFLYPTYKCVYEAKLRCYPPKSDITVTESKAEVRVLAFLDHTTDRILSIQMEVIQTLSAEMQENLTLIFK